MNMKNNYQHNFINENIKKMYSLSSLVLIIFFLLLTIISCSKNPVEPKEEPPPPGRRDYVWTVDTIKVPFFIIERIWGSSPDDVWIVGPGGGLDQTIWHYDGIRWKTDGISRGISPNCIWGFSRDNIWIAGSEGQIWHYNGIRWERNYHYVRDDYYAFQEIWGDAPDNIYALGFTETNGVRRASMLRYNGDMWKELYVPPFSYSFIRMRKDTKGSKNLFIYGIGRDSNQKIISAIFEYNGKTISKIFETYFNQKTNPHIQEIRDKIYILIGNTINKYINNQFVPFYAIELQNFGGQFWGRNENDIFFRMLDGIVHYNGITSEYIYKFNTSVSISDAIIFKNTVYFIATDFNNNNNLIFKGVLQSENN